MDKVGASGKYETETLALLEHTVTALLMVYLKV
jgi:hypothetical protein